MPPRDMVRIRSPGWGARTGRRWGHRENDAVTQAGGVKGSGYLVFCECHSDPIPNGRLTGVRPAGGPAEDLSSSSALRMAMGPHSQISVHSLSPTVSTH